MRESNYTFPPSNRAVISINQMLYDRRALDTNSTLALLNNLCQLTYLTSTSPRIREVLTMDGGLERMLDILRESALPREPTMPDLWGLNGPSTARTINVDRAISLRHSLAFQCVVNIGVRGNENIRTRVVQAGALDIVAQILESWLKKNGVAIFSNALGSQAAVDAQAAGIQLPGVTRHRRTGQSRHHREAHQPSEQSQPATQPAQAPTQAPSTPNSAPPVPSTPANIPITSPRTTAAVPQTSRGIGQFVTAITNRLGSRHQAPPAQIVPDARRPGSGADTDVDMADAETEGGETDTNDTDAGGDTSMDVEYLDGDAAAGPSQVTTTPRARLPLLPLQIPRRSPDLGSDQPSTSVSSTAGSPSGDEPAAIPRARSDVSLNLTNQNIAPGRPRSGLAARHAHVTAVPETTSTHSSPVGSPVNVEYIEGTRGRRGTVVGRPLLVPPRDTTRRQDESEASDAGETDLAQATITAGIAAAAANAAMEAAAAVRNQSPNGPQPSIVDGAGAGMAPEEPDPEILAAEQARFDMEAGAPPGQPGAAQTPRVNTTEVPLAQTVAADLAVQVPAGPPAQIIIANGAPRGFQDLASYVGVSMLLNPEGTNYSEDNILLALQLLAYLSKYPHVRAAFHHPRRPMHRTFELGADDSEVPLPQRPPASETPNIFSLVERFTFRPSPSDPHMFRIPQEIQYWAGVIMRNACRKDDAQGGIRQCAYMSCGRWEVFPREFAKCRRCRKAKYCSKDCQSKAWSEGHRFWCSIRSEPEPSVDPAAAPGGGGSRREQPRRDDDDDDVEMGDATQPSAAGGGTAALQTTPRAPGARQHAAGEQLVTADSMETTSGQSTPRASSPVQTIPQGATMPILRHSTATSQSSSSTPPLPPTTTPPPAPMLSPARTPNSGTLPVFLKRGGGPGPSSTSAMNAAMGMNRL